MNNIDKLKYLFETNKRKNTTCDFVITLSASIILLAMFVRNIDVEELKEIEDPKTEDDKNE